MIRCFSIALLIILSCWHLPLYGQDEEIIQVNAQLSEQSISQEEVVILGVVISGNTMIRAADVQLPSLKDFRIISQSSRTRTEIVNGRTTSALQYLYYLVPRRAGSLSIPAIDVVYEGKSYTTDPLTIDVAKAEKDSRIITRMLTDKSTVYVGEQIHFELQILFSTKIRVSNYEPLEQPELEGFINIPDPTLTRQEKQVVDLNKDRYLQFTLARNILFPLSPGRKAIRGIPFQIEYYESDFGNNRRYGERTADDVVVTVKPLPSPSPESFSGTIGKYYIDWSIDRTEGRAQEPFTLVVTIQGAGDIERISQPKLNMPEHIEVISADNAVSTSYKDGVWGGSQRWEYILVPGEPGEEVLGPLEYVFFNPRTEQYETATTEPITLKLTEAEAAPGGFTPQQMRPEAIEEDIRFIKEEHTGQPVSRMPPLWLILLLLIVPPLVNLTTVILQKVGGAARGRTPGKRKRRALRTAIEILDRVGRGDRPATTDELDQIARAIRGYFSERFGLSAGASQMEMRGALRPKDLQESNEMNTVARILDRCAAGRYAPPSMKDTTLSDLTGDAREALQRLEERL